MKEVRFNIKGMTCDHCVEAVKEELYKLESVKIKEIEIGSATIEYDEEKVERIDLIEAIERVGYRVFA